MYTSKRKVIQTATAIVALISFSGLAEAAKDKKASKVTCEDYVNLDEAARPRVVYYIEGLSATGKKEDALLEVDEVSDPVAYVTEECKKTPKETVWKKVENFGHHVRKKL